MTHHVYYMVYKRSPDDIDFHGIFASREDATNYKHGDWIHHPNLAMLQAKNGSWVAHKRRLIGDPNEIKNNTVYVLLSEKDKRVQVAEIYATANAGISKQGQGWWDKHTSQGWRSGTGDLWIIRESKFWGDSWSVAQEPEMSVWYNLYRTIDPSAYPDAREFIVSESVDVPSTSGYSGKFRKGDRLFRKGERLLAIPINDAQCRVVAGWHAEDNEWRDPLASYSYPGEYRIESKYVSESLD